MPAYGDLDSWLLIVGLAPGLKGANRTGRPFTGDAAGDLLFSTLLKVGLATGNYGADPDDSLRLNGCRITNAVRCVPPANRPTPAEVRACNRFLRAELQAMANLQAIVALGSVAHNAVLAAYDVRQPDHPFAHGAVRPLSQGVVMVSSYHCSRQNTNTGRLSPAMFEAVFAALPAPTTP